MKKQVFLYLLSIFISFPVGADSIDDLVRREGLYYKKFSDVPFTGEINEGLFRGNLDKGQLQGLWHRYHPNGQLLSAGEYLNDKHHGPWKTFYETGNPMEIGSYEKGKPVGLWKIYLDQNHQQSYEFGKYDRGIRIGGWTKYDILRDPIGPYVTYHYDNGQVSASGLSPNLLREGWWEYFYEDGTIRAKGHFKNNKKDGFWVMFNPDGTKDTDSTGTYEDDYKISD